jgi:hypothetical protein
MARPPGEHAGNSGRLPASRRTLLRTTTAGAAGNLAGCTGRDGLPDPTSPSSSTPSGDATPQAVRTPSGSDGAAVQRAIDRVASDVSDGGYAFVEGDPATRYDVSETITLPSNVFLRNFHLRMADGAQTPVIESARFDELEGSNTWAANEGVPYNFGLVNVHVDGNKANNGGRVASEDGQGRFFEAEPQDPDRSGRGVAFYGKRWWVDNVVIRDCPRTGFYTEGAAKGGQPSGWKDLPESQIGRLWVRNCDDDGVVYRGPHDGQATTIVGVLNDGHGFACQGGDDYSGAGFVVSRLHTYTNAEPQLLADGFGAVWNYVDNEKECVIDEPGFFVHHLYCGGGWTGPSAVRIEQPARIHTLSMNGEGEGTALTIDARGTHVGRADIGQYARAVEVNGLRSRIDHITARGEGGDVGLTVDAPEVWIGKAALTNYATAVEVDELGARFDHLAARSGSGPGVRIDGRDAYLGESFVQSFDGDGLVVSAKNARLGRVWAQNNARDGVRIRANNAQIERAAAPGNGRYGLYLGKPDADLVGLDVTALRMNDNGRAGFRYGGGARNVVRLHGYVGEDATGYDTDGALPSETDDFTVHLGGPGDGVGLSEERTSTTLTGDGSTTRFAIAHDLLVEPTVVLPAAGDAATPAIAGVAERDADQFAVEFATPPAADESVRVDWTASIGGL